MATVLEDTPNPFLGRIFRELRSPDLQRDRHRFRENLRLLGTILGYEVAKTLPTTVIEAATPLGVRSLRILDQEPVLCAILRAALPFWDGMLEVFRSADSMIIGASRREGKRSRGAMEMTVDFTYRALPKADGKDWIMVDPMLATGSTLIGVYKELRDRGMKPRRLIVASAIAYRGAFDRLKAAMPEVEIWSCAADDQLNDDGYIVPGLGDAGDLCFGEKHP